MSSKTDQVSADKEFNFLLRNPGGPPPEGFFFVVFLYLEKY